MPIPYWIHEKGAPRISNGSDFAAVQASFQTWENIQTANIKFAFRGTTTAGIVGHDGMNVVTFTDTSAPLGSSTIAATFSFFRTENGQTMFDEADIAFNPAIDFSTSGETNKFDIQSVLTHEIGHLLGLDHSALVSSVMVPFGVPSQLDQRTLAYDDVAGIMEIYGTASGTGQIRGTIEADGTPVFGAHVVAVNSDGTPIVSTLSQRDGSYILRFLPPDTYAVYAESLDGPVTRLNLGGGSTGFFSSVRTNFGTTYFGNVSGLSEAAKIAVGPNGVATADIRMFPPSATGLRLTRPSFGIRMPRGRTVTVTGGGVDITDGVLLTGSNSGLQFGPMTFGGRITSTAPTSVSVQLTVLNSTPLGPKNLIVNRGTDTSILSGAFVITDSYPSGISVSPSTGPVEGGTLVTVNGTDFRSGARVFFAGLAGADGRVIDSNTIQVTSPANVSGAANVVVVNPDGTWAVGSQVFGYSSQPPTISRVSPLDGPPSTRVVIEGDHFDSRTQNIEVAFNGTTAKIISASVNAITAVVPFGATTGPITVSVFVQTATGPAFTVTAAPTSTNLAGRSFNFIDASSSTGGTVLTFSNNDDAIALVRLPFDFILFRDIYVADSQISISTDGFLSLEPLSISEWQNAPLPSTTVLRPSGSAGTVPPSLIAPFWDDLIMPPQAAITTKTVGAAPNRQFIVQWSNMSLLDENGRDLNANLTFEAILFEGTNDIQFLYRSMSGPRSDGSSATIGAQNLKRDTAIQTGFNQSIVASGYFTTYPFQNGSYVEAVPDATPPSKPLVTDEGPLTSNSTQLAASWMSNDPESGIREYRYAIGSTPEGADVRPFISTTQSSIVVSGLNLQVGATYYFAVKAINGAGLESEVGVSAGVRFDPTYQPQVKIIPSSPQSATVFTGIAFLAKTGMSVVLRAFDGNGNLVAGPGVRNPSSITLAAGQQYAKLVSELFGLQSFDGWIEADASAPGLGIFVATGSWDMLQLDGTVPRDPSADFVLPHGAALAVLVNPSGRPATVTLTDFASAQTQSLTIPARGKIVMPLAGAVRVRSSEPLATAGIPVSDAQSTLVFPQAVVGGGYSSTLSLVNIGTAPANATVTFGTASANISLPANAAARVSISDLLKLSGDTIRTGAVRVTSMSLFGASPSLIGILDIQNSSGGASVAAKATGTDFTFPYVANANGFFTGLAFATGSEPAKITIDVYSADGGTPKSASITLAANQQFSALLSDLVAASAAQLGGYVRIRSDQPIWGWMIYGTDKVLVSGPPL